MFVVRETNTHRTNTHSTTQIPNSPVNSPLIVISVGATRIQEPVLYPGLGQAPIPCDAKTQSTALDPPIVGAAKDYRDTPWASVFSS